LLLVGATFVIGLIFTDTIIMFAQPNLFLRQAAIGSCLIFKLSYIIDRKGKQDRPGEDKDGTVVVPNCQGADYDTFASRAVPVDQIWTVKRAALSRDFGRY
jgi:hypothetical protein